MSDHSEPVVTISTPGRSRKTSRQASDFVAISEKIRAAGLMRRRYGYYWTKLLAVPIVFGVCMAAFVVIGDTWWQLILAAAFAFVFTQIAFLGHDAAHRQIFRSGKWNDWTSLIIGDLFVGMSYGWWQHKHTRHHANPNKEGADPDIDLPVIAFTPSRVASAQSRVVKWLIAHQGWFFFPVLLLEGLSLHASSVRRVFARETVARRYVEIAFLLLRIGGYLALVFLILSPGVAAAFLGIQLGLFGFYMGMAFAPNHKGMPLVPHDASLDFLRRQVLMSRNIRGNRLLDFLMGGLNWVRYTETGLWQSYGIVLQYINRVGLGERDPFECPLLAQRQTPG